MKMEDTALDIDIKVLNKCARLLSTLNWLRSSTSPMPKETGEGQGSIGPMS